MFWRKRKQSEGFQKEGWGGLLEKMTSEQIPKQRGAEDQQRQSFYGGGRLRGSSSHHPI